MSYRELTRPARPGQAVHANPEANFYSKRSKQSWKTSAAAGSSEGKKQAVWPGQPTGTFENS